MGCGEDCLRCLLGGCSSLKVVRCKVAVGFVGMTVVL